VNKAEPEKMDLTVIVCTHNRCDSLAKTLHSIALSRMPHPVEWEVLVVDNNSNDHTRELVAEFCEQYPGRFRYLFERQPGLSCARNAGILEARGTVVVFTDDDVIVDSMWLQNLTANMLEHEWAGVGGRVLPVWECSPPAWLKAGQWYTLGPLPNFDFGPHACELTRPPFGANMGFRRAMFEKYGYFRTDLGRRPNSLMSNEDTEFAGRLLAAGERLRYEPSAIVHHPVQKDRMEKQYFLAWWFHKGQANIREFGIQPGTRYSILAIPLYLFRNLAVRILKWVFSVNPVTRFSNKLRVWSKAGEILECLRNPTASKKMQDCNATTRWIGAAKS